MKTVKVRVAVAVDPEGEWNAAGWSREDGTPVDAEAMDMAVETVGDGDARYWLVADLPVPEPVEVAAEVEDAG